jgi:hypothetical protein
MWRPLLSTHSSKRFWKFLITRCSMLGEIATTSSLMLFQIHRCPWFLFIHLALEISLEEEVLRLGTLVPINIEVQTKYPLSQDRIAVFEIHLHSKSPMFYKLSLHDDWNALSLARRALKDKFPTPTFPLTTVMPNRQVFLPDPVQEQGWSPVICHFTVMSKIANVSGKWRLHQICLQSEVWPFHIDPIERFILLRCDTVVVGWVVPDVSKDRTVFFFRVSEFKQMIFLALLDSEYSNSRFCASGSPDLLFVGCHALPTGTFYKCNSPIIAFNNLKPKIRIYVFTMRGDREISVIVMTRYAVDDPRFESQQV